MKKVTKILIGVLIGAVVLAGGSIATISIINAVNKKAAEKAMNVNPEDHKSDTASLLDEYNNDPNKEFSIADLVNIGLEKYKQCDNCYSFGVGTASTVVSQSIRSAQIKNGDKYFEESVSYSLMEKIATRTYQNGENGQTDTYIGEAINSLKGKYPEEPVHYSYSDYKESWGKNLDEVFIYVISNDTVDKENSKAEKLDNGNIQISLRLDNEISTYYYKKQMKTISNLDTYPIFKRVDHVYTFSSDLKLLSCSVDEEYKVTKKITVTVKNKINYTYHYDEYLKIPEMGENLDYPEK